MTFDEFTDRQVDYLAPGLLSLEERRALKQILTNGTLLRAMAHALFRRSEIAGILLAIDMTDPNVVPKLARLQGEAMGVNIAFERLFTLAEEKDDDT